MINTKRINIDFITRNKFHKEYIENVVLKYVEQMMPSTAIFSYKFIDQPFRAVPEYQANGNGSEGELIRAEVDGIIADGNNQYFVEHPLPNTI